MKILIVAIARCLAADSADIARETRRIFRYATPLYRNAILARVQLLHRLQYPIQEKGYPDRAPLSNSLAETYSGVISRYIYLREYLVSFVFFFHQ